LYWLANYLAKDGTPLRAGMIVTTGSYCGALDVPIDTPLTFKYGDLGSLSVTLNRA
jgi:2-keto-4-pentenoate hydratase